LVLGGSFFFLRSQGAKPESEASAPAAAKAEVTQIKLTPELQKRAQVATEPVGKRPLAPTLELVGSVDFDPNAVADVGGRITGRITKLMVSVGDTVTEGQPLLEIESNELGEALATLLSARANLIAAENQLQRESALGQKQLSSALVVETARANAKALQAEAAGAEQRLLAMGLSSGELARLGAGAGPKRITLRAPLAGEVVERYAMLGQVVSATNPVLRIADLSRLWVELALFERDISRVQVGNPVEILSETYPDKKFAAKVAFVNASIDEATRTATVRIEVPNPERLLRPGQFVRARVARSDKGEPVIAILRKAVQQIDGQFGVFVEKGPGSYVAVPVELGRADGDLVEITRGLLEGDRVVTQGGFVLKSELLR
jgi:cobalt-zinc-cadmium efflux system membrane fusion protein